MIKAGMHILAPVFVVLFNRILTREIYPESWGDGFIIPVFKADDVNDPSNYRGISITSCLAKLFSLLLNNRLQHFVEQRNIMSEFQIGFIKNHRTSDHLFVLKCIIEEAKRKKQPIYRTLDHISSCHSLLPIIDACLFGVILLLFITLR